MTKRPAGARRWVRIGILVALVLAWRAWQVTRSSLPSTTAVGTAEQDPQERELREAARAAPGDAEAQRALAEYLLRARRPYEAMWAFQDTLDLRPGDAEARRGLARALIIAQLPGRALEVLAATNDQRPTKGDQRGRRTTTEAAVGRTIPDVGRWSLVVGRERSDLEDRRVAAAAYLARGDAMGAVTMLEAAQGGHPPRFGASGSERQRWEALEGSAAGLLDLAHALEALGEDGPAASAYQRHLRLDPESMEGQLGLARVAVRQRDIPTAAGALRRAREIAPNDPRPLYERARAAETLAGPRAERAEPEGAIGLYRRVLAASPSYGPAHLRLGLLELRQGRAEEAVRHLRQAVVAAGGSRAEARLHLAAALDAAGEKGEAAHERGLYYEATERPHLAAREYRRLATLGSSREDPSLLLSAALSQMEKDEEAAEVARQGLARNPEDLRVRTRRAMLLMMTDDRAQAAALCRRWIQERPAWAEPYRLLARIEREALHPAEAVRFMEQALEREPENHEYLLELSRSLLAIGTPDALRRAAEALRRGLTLAPADPEIHLRLGEALEKLGDLEGARMHYLRSMDRARSLHFGAYALSQLCPRLKKPARARFYAENVRVIRERQDATQALWRRLHRSPEDAEARARMAEVLLNAGESRAAIYHLEMSLRRRPDRERQEQLEVLRRLEAMREG
jgi:tetratricopeptide (TPR) repeat protein